MSGDGLRFAKYHGTGNDFVMIEDLDDRMELTPELVARLCDRHLGVGADGVIRVAPSTRAAFFMDYWNADGGIAEMCGNGVRCLAKLVYDRGLTRDAELAIDTRAGVKHVVLDVDGGAVSSVRVDMGPPALERRAIPMRGDPDARFVGQPFDAAGRPWRATAVSMGNPHLVLLGDGDVASLDLPRVGPPLEHHPDFPEGTNVEFIRVRDGRIDVRVWERGSGATMACGTGACASLVGAAVQGLVPRRATVAFPGGELEVEWAEDDHVYLTGPATFVFEGQLSERWMAAAAGAAAR
ncbi:MAG TPA: diaminopimelate epimerase [Actinomycetota bacterium]|nr:diaminopimelate epimerase [Actinomycetota bacterium]